MQQTQNYKLNKPDINDYAKIDVLNGNADIIDGKLKEASNKIDVLTGNLNTTNSKIDTHVSEIATTKKLGHFKPDGETIEVDPVTGVAKVIGGTGGTKKFEGNDLNELLEDGFWSIKENTLNAVTNSVWTVQVIKSFDGNTITQISYKEDSNNVRENVYKRVATKGSDGKYTWGTAAANMSGYLNNWKIISMNLSDSLSGGVLTGASSNALKEVNDKISSANIASSVFAPFQNEIGTGLRYRVMGNIVSVGGTIRVTQTSTNNTICHMPSNISPNSFVPFVVLKQRGSTHSYVHGFLNSGGVMGIDDIYMSGMAVGDVLNIGFTYNTKVN